jgi:hypothetical protein
MINPCRRALNKPPLVLFVNKKPLIVLQEVNTLLLSLYLVLFHFFVSSGCCTLSLWMLIKEVLIPSNEKGVVLKVQY